LGNKKTAITKNSHDSGYGNLYRPGLGLIPAADKKRKTKLAVAAAPEPYPQILRS